MELKIEIKTFINDFEERIQMLGVVRIEPSANLANNPNRNLNNKIGGDILIEQILHLVDNLEAIILIILILLDNKFQEVIKNGLIQVLTAQLKQHLHRVQVPLMSGRTSLAQLGDLEHQTVPEVLVGGRVQARQHF